MTRQQLRTELAARGLAKQLDAARALGVEQSSVSRWINGSRPVPGWIEVALRGIRKKRAA